VQKHNSLKPSRNFGTFVLHEEINFLSKGAEKSERAKFIDTKHGSKDRGTKAGT
jgi:hypothetical protein